MALTPPAIPVTKVALMEEDESMVEEEKQTVLDAPLLAGTVDQ